LRLAFRQAHDFTTLPAPVHRSGGQMNRAEPHAAEEPPGRLQSLRPRLRALGQLLLIAVVVVAATTSGDSGLNQVERIHARGSLTMLTVNGASTYYLGAEDETGFEYELALAFARYLDVPLEVIVVPSVADLVPAL